MEKKINLNEVNGVTGMLFAGRGRHYAWGDSYPTSDVTGPASVTDVNTEWGSGKWFIFYQEDCAFPILYAVQHKSFESAIDEFIDWQVDQLKIPDADLKDYIDGGGNLECYHTSYGVPVDVSTVQGFEVQLIELRCE